MGANSSHHEPLDRNKHGMSFRRSSSMRQTKSKGSNKSPPRRMEKIRRSFRDSFRRRKETISEASKPHLWQTDEMDVRSGTCFFHVKYLGCVEVFESRGMQTCEEALRVMKNRRRPVKAILYVSGDGLRVVEDDTKGLIVDQTIEKVSFCAPDRNHDRGFSYICRDGTTRRWMCHGFLALRESGERLSHAVGCAFAVCLERKQKRDKECSVTMSFDLTNSTFTRTGSFRQQTLTEKLQDTTHANNNLNSMVTAVSNTSTSNNPLSTTTVININNNIANYNRKENIPVRTTPKISTHAIERPHATISMLQRQGSFRGLSHLNHASPFKRQLSLRISDLPSNLERTRSHSVEYTLDPKKQNSQFLHAKTPVSPIPEVSPTHSHDSNTVVANNTVTDQVSAMCQQLSQGLSLLTNNDDLLGSQNNQLNALQTLSAKNLFAQRVSDFSSQLIELQPTSPLPQLNSTYTIHKSCSENGGEHEQSTLQNVSNSSFASAADANALNNNNNGHPACRGLGDDLSSSLQSQPMSQSTVSSAENIPLTPPATPPLSSNGAAAAAAQLPKPDQWLGKVAQSTMGAGAGSSASSERLQRASTSGGYGSPPTARRAPAAHTRAYSLSSAETVLSRAAAAAAPTSAERSADATFIIDWASLAVETPKAPAKSTNPFLSSPCSGSEQPIKTFEVQM